MLTSAIMIMSAVGLASAQNIAADLWNMHVPSTCNADCYQWSTVVGDCFRSSNTTFSASLNTNDWNSFNFTGDLFGLSQQCGCSAVAIQASESCLACASKHLCLEPVLHMQDYSMLCENPLVNGPMLFMRYHSKMGTCKVPETTSSEEPTSTTSSEEPTSTTSSEEPTTSTEEPTSTSDSGSGTSSSTPCETTSSTLGSGASHRNGRYWTRR